MYFNKHHIYTLTGIVSETDNPIHDEITGRYCILDYFEPQKFGWFQVEMDDGYHRICTTVVKNVMASDDRREVVVTTANSVYTFVFEADLTPVCDEKEA